MDGMSEKIFGELKMIRDVWPHPKTVERLKSLAIDAATKGLTIIGGTKRKEKHNYYPRILVRRTGDTLTCALLECSALTESTIYSLWPKDSMFSIRFLIGVLNSRLLGFYCKCRCVTNQQGYPQILLSDLLELPIPTATSTQQTPITTLVDRILAAKKKDPQADTTALEAEIDKLVYKLYGITDEKEISVIEGRKVEEGVGCTLKQKDAQERVPTSGALRTTRPTRRDDDDEMLE